jgi:excisionase family DNA binding protein
MARESQFGMRKNPAPQQRQHGLRPAAEIASDTALMNQSVQPPEKLISNSHKNEAQPPPHAAPMRAATVGENHTQNRLLTIREVADLLQVPVSWVYARTRKRSFEKIPGYRLGKYWRFSEAEVLVWLQSQKRGGRAA